MLILTLYLFLKKIRRIFSEAVRTVCTLRPVCSVSTQLKGPGEGLWFDEVIAGHLGLAM